MERYKELMREANNNLKIADHMIYVTYPLINDPKLIIGIIERLDKALINAVDAVLNYDYLYKRISKVPEDLREKLEMFRDFSIKRYNFSRDILVLVNNLKDLLEFRDKSNVEFRRRENYVVCSSGYNTKTIDIRKVKGYVNETKEFVLRLNKLLQNGL